MSHEALAAWARGLPDGSTGWRCDDVKKLRARYDDITTPEFDAELRYEKLFGFAARRPRITVRFQLTIQNPDRELPPRQGITLLVGDQLFGREGNWRIVGVILDERVASVVELFLEE